jgi:hypothetical protein
MELKRELCQSDRNEILRHVEQLEKYLEYEHGVIVNGSLESIRDIVSQPRHPQGNEGSFTGISTKELHYLMKLAAKRANELVEQHNKGCDKPKEIEARYEAFKDRAIAIGQELERRILALPTPQK